MRQTRGWERHHRLRFGWGCQMKNSTMKRNCWMSCWSLRTMIQSLSCCWKRSWNSTRTTMNSRSWKMKS
jgi:hypothetical protein